MAAPDRKRILVVEDDESVRKLVERALSASYDVETAADGLAALRRLKLQPAPDLVICDIMMPGIDGLSVARNMKAGALTRQTPIVFLTARTSPQDVIHGIQAGARQYITKPFKIGDLLKLVQQVLGR